MLYDKLKKNNRIPFHMPGHKRNTKLLGEKFPYELDTTEIEGFDNLHDPSGIIKEIEKKAKEVYESDNSFILVNGSTVGILAGITSVLKKGDRVLIARNCHKSVYNAIELAGAEAEYLLPELDEYGICKAISIKELEKKIKKFTPKLIVITSPTYEGVRSDIKSISNVAHSYSIPILLDAAHGAQYIDDVIFADITVMSLHKTLPALTQCALAHINGNLVSSEEFRIKLSVFETSSPSYIFMASIEECLSFISTNHHLFQKLIDERKKLLKECEALKYLKVFEYDDISKIIVFTGCSDINGTALADKLRNEFDIEVEMSCENYLVLITTICDEFRDYELLYKALSSIDKQLHSEEFNPRHNILIPEKSCSVDEIDCCSFTDLKNAINKISAEYIWAYPPGIPIIAPGEIISREIIEYLEHLLNNNVNVQSTRGKLPKKICVKLL